MLNNKNNRFGRKLEDGHAAHAADHQKWSRRQFLSNSSMMAAGGTLLGSSPLFSWASPLFSSLYENPDNDRVLILIRLNGGNDGLNTIVPITNSDALDSNYQGRLQAYKGFRPNLKLTQNLNPLTDTQGIADFGLPYEMGTINNGIATGLYELWNKGNMAVIHNVGYPQHNRSHFTGSDLWASGAENDTSTTDERKYSGWLGRYFNETLPAFLSTPPEIPPAIQIGAANNLIFKGKSGIPFDLVFRDVDSFKELIEQGSLYGTDDFDITCEEDEVVRTSIANLERVYVRQVNNRAFRYAEKVQEAYNKTTNIDKDDTMSELRKKMAIVSRLIKAKLGTKIYMVSINGFDTHANQMSQTDGHLALLKELSDAIEVTFKDLGDHADRVMMMTFSEFGRTVKDNGTGTDHGTLAPMMLFGNNVNGQNFYGTPIDLSGDKVDEGLGGLIYFENKNGFEAQPGAIDFRAVYDRVLRDWLCADAQTSEDTLNYKVSDNTQLNPYSTCNNNCNDPLGGMILGGCNSTASQSSTVDSYISSLITLGYNVVGNTVEIKYATKMPAAIQLKILDDNDKIVEYMEDGELEDLQLINTYQEAGSYLYKLENTNIKLVKNTKYICQLEVNGMLVKRQLVIH